MGFSHLQVLSRQQKLKNNSKFGIQTVTKQIHTQFVFFFLCPNFPEQKKSTAQSILLIYLITYLTFTLQPWFLSTIFHPLKGARFPPLGSFPHTVLPARFPEPWISRCPSQLPAFQNLLIHNELPPGRWWISTRWTMGRLWDFSEHP